MGPDFNAKMVVKSLTSQQLVRIHQLLRQAKFDDPNGHVSYIVFIISHLNFINYCYFFVYSLLDAYFQCLSPAGEYNLRLGIIKELHPDMVATYSGRLWFNIKVLPDLSLQIIASGDFYIFQSTIICNLWVVVEWIMSTEHALHRTLPVGNSKGTANRCRLVIGP